MIFFFFMILITSSYSVEWLYDLMLLNKEAPYIGNRTQRKCYIVSNFSLYIFSNSCIIR